MKSSKKSQISSYLLFVYINNQDRKWRMPVLVFSSALGKTPNRSASGASVKMLWSVKSFSNSLFSSVPVKVSLWNQQMKVGHMFPCSRPTLELCKLECIEHLPIYFRYIFHF